MYTQDLVLTLLNNEDNIKTLTNYCEYLANKYNKTIEGNYRIKYNALYSLLFYPVSKDRII